jgi:hypothetical protein
MGSNYRSLDKNAASVVLLLSSFQLTCQMTDLELILNILEYLQKIFINIVKSISPLIDTV